MKTLNGLALILALSGAAMASTGVQAQSPATGKVTDMSSAEVRKVDKEARKITLKHGEIKNLDMPPMTMVFQVRELALLDKAKAGDKVSFSAEKIDGAYVVTAIEVAK